MITTTATWTTTENLPHAGKALESVEMLTSSTAGREMDAATIRRDTSDMGAQQRARPSDLTPESPEWMRQMVAYYHDLPRDERGPEAARRIFGDVAEPRDEYEVEQ